MYGARKWEIVGDRVEEVKSVQLKRASNFKLKHETLFCELEYEIFKWIPHQTNSFSQNSSKELMKLEKEFKYFAIAYKTLYDLPTSPTPCLPWRLTQYFFLSTFDGW